MNKEPITIPYTLLITTNNSDTNVHSFNLTMLHNLVNKLHNSHDQDLVEYFRLTQSAMPR
jgi:hypothetical protein